MKLTKKKGGAIAAALILAAGGAVVLSGNTRAPEEDAWGGGGSSGASNGIGGAGGFETFAEQLQGILTNGAGDTMQPQDMWNESSLLDEAPAYDIRRTLPDTSITINGAQSNSTFETARTWFLETFDPSPKPGELTIGDVMKNPLLAFTPNAKSPSSSPSVAASKAASSSKSSGGNSSATVKESNNAKTANMKQQAANEGVKLVGLAPSAADKWSGFFGA